jgi:hypothetical protein
MPFIYVDHDAPLPATPPLRVRVEGGNHLIVGFAPSSRRACQHIDSSPQISCTPVALQTDHVPITPCAPGVGAPDQRFLLPSPLPSSRAGLVLHMAQAMSTTQTIWLPRAVSTDSTSFPIFPLTTPTRTSSVSFEPLLTLLTCYCLLLFLLSVVPTVAPRQPWPVPEALAQWYSVCGSVDLLS